LLNCQKRYKDTKIENNDKFQISNDPTLLSIELVCVHLSVFLFKNIILNYYVKQTGQANQFPITKFSMRYILSFWSASWRTESFRGNT